MPKMRGKRLAMQYSSFSNELDFIAPTTERQLFPILKHSLGHFIADYPVWALLIVEGHTLTYSC